MKTINLVMMIDDDIMTTFINKRILKIIGYTGRTITFQNGLEALRYMENAVSNKEEIPDMILVDINMPKMNGWEFLDAFSKLHNINKTISVVMLTNSVNKEDTIRSSQYEVVDHLLNKPLSEFEFKKLLKMHTSDNNLMTG